MLANIVALQDNTFVNVSFIFCEQLIQRNLITDSYHANNERFT